MAVFYLDPEGGNDANDGTTFANRWKTLTSGATSARITPGDTIRVMASKDATSLGQNATWTNGSKTITLTSVVTANITDCELAWSAATNVTATTSTSTFREGTKSANLAIAAAFTTGKVASFATGTLDLSAYQQVSFMINPSLNVAASTLTLTLCSDTAGATPVHTISIPTIGSGTWCPVVFDNGAALSSSIQSVALNALLDPGTITINIDNIIACKASSAADSLTHRSLIGKDANLPWAATTAYSTGVKRKPTSPNRTGFCYQATTGGTSGSTEPTWPKEIGLTVGDGSVTWTCVTLEETWWPIASINGTTVTLTGYGADSVANTRGYAGVTETVTTCKRETVMPVAVANTSNANASMTIQKSGTAQAVFTLTGGWNRTDMSTQTGETWWDGQTGFGSGIVATSGKNYWKYNNMHMVRWADGMVMSNCLNVTFDNVHLNGNGTALLAASGVRWEFNNVVMAADQVGWSVSGSSYNAKCLQVICNTSGNSWFFQPGYSDMNYFWWRNNSVSCSLQPGGTNQGAFVRIKNFKSDNNATTVLTSMGGGIDFINPSFGEANPIADPTANLDAWVTVTKYNGTANDHRRITDSGSIVSATDQRNTPSGISWKFLPTSTNRGETYPLRMPIAQIKCAANVQRTVQIYCRRDNANIKGRLVMRGGQLAGIGQEQTVDCAPTINTWVQSSALTFTPTEDGVVEIEFHVWDGIGTTNSFWIDDLSVT